MDPFHERLARLGLGAVAPFGFVLAGGYALRAAGLLDLPCGDLDIFTVWARRHEFDPAVAAIVVAYRRNGLTVEVDRRLDTFVRLLVTARRTGQFSKVEMIAQARTRPPVPTAIGPVLHPDDALGGKMQALSRRQAPRDFVDVDTALCSGRYSREGLLWLARAVAAATFDTGAFVDALGMAARHPDDVFAPYGVEGRRLAGLRSRFASWRADLLAAPA